MHSIADGVDKGSFDERGFVVLRGLFEGEQGERMIEDLERISGRRRIDWSRASTLERASGLSGWTAPDGVVKHPEFWGVIDDPRLLSAVRTLVGPDARFLQHNDLHVGFSSFNWHRDSVSRTYGIGSDWDTREPYRLLRVGIYLLGGQDGFRFGVIPGTHAPPAPGGEGRRRRIEKSGGMLAHLRRAVTGNNPSPPGTEWLSLGDGDAVIFDPRLIHTGTPADGPKYSVFVGYGTPGFHFDNHSHYYRHLRPELGYGDLPPALRARLSAEGLYHEAGQPSEELSGASIPRGGVRQLARKIRSSM